MHTHHPQTQTQSLTHTHMHTHSHTHLLTHTLTHPPHTPCTQYTRRYNTHTHTHTNNHAPTHSCTHSLTHSLTYPLTHLPTRSPTMYTIHNAAQNEHTHPAHRQQSYIYRYIVISYCTHTQTHSLAHPHYVYNTHADTIHSLPLSLSLSHTHTNNHTHTHSLTHSLTFPPTDPLTHLSSVGSPEGLVGRYGAIGVEVAHHPVLTLRGEPVTHLRLQLQQTSVIWARELDLGEG